MNFTYLQAWFTYYIFTYDMIGSHVVNYYYPVRFYKIKISLLSPILQFVLFLKQYLNLYSNIKI